VRRLAVNTLAVKRRQVLVSERDPIFRASLGVALTALGCELHPASLLEGLRATPGPDAVVAEAAQIDTAVRRELFLLRARQPSVRVGVVGEASSLEDTMAAIGVAAHQRISRKLDPPALLAVLTALIR
jgi:DNA-binding response OmpR family regulator